MAAHDHGQYRMPRAKEDVHPEDVLPPRDLAPQRHPSEHTPKLRLVNATTGEIVCEDCKRAQEELRLARQELAEAEAELRKYRSALTRATNQAAKERAEHPRRREIKEVFDKWRECTGHPNAKLTDDRFDALEKWLKIYTADQIYWACAYVGAFPYLKPGGYGERQADPPRGASRTDRKDDLVYICAEGGRFEKFSNLGYRMLRQQGKIAAQTLFS